MIATNTYASPLVEDFLIQLRELNLTRYASEAAVEMNFGSVEELEDAVRRAFEACIAMNLDVQGNFKRTYVCSVSGVLCDWRLSYFAYRLVCINGRTENPSVARMQSELVRLIK